MHKSPKYAVPLAAFAVAFLFAASAVSMAEDFKYPLSNAGTQKGPTIKLDPNTPKKQPTHTMGTVVAHNPNGPLKGPKDRELHESGMGKLLGDVKQGDPKTPKRAPTSGVTPG